MTGPFPFGVTVTVHRQARSRFGDRTDTTSHTVAGCAIAQSLGQSVRASKESGGNLADTVATGQVLYGPYDADIQSSDVIELPDGLRYQVEGDPARWSSPFTGQTFGCQVTLERVRG